MISLFFLPPVLRMCLLADDLVDCTDMLGTPQSQSLCRIWLHPSLCPMLMRRQACNGRLQWLALKSCCAWQRASSSAQQRSMQKSTSSSSWMLLGRVSGLV